MPLFVRAIAPVFLGAASVCAHGFVANITAGGTIHENYDPSTFPAMDKPPDVAGWAVDQPDFGYISPQGFDTPDIICHRSATPGALHIPITAGSTLTMQWNFWPQGHKGPVVTYLAACNGSCAGVDKTDLRFFKIQELGLMNAEDGIYAADELILSNYTWNVTVPEDIASGNYVLRHELIALHRGGELNGAQLYPQCVNLNITSEGSAQPVGVPGVELYEPKDAGILYDVWAFEDEYPIPGPKLWTG